MSSSKKFQGTAFSQRQSMLVNEHVFLTQNCVCPTHEVSFFLFSVLPFFRSFPFFLILSNSSSFFLFLSIFLSSFFFLSFIISFFLSLSRNLMGFALLRLYGLKCEIKWIVTKTKEPRGSFMWFKEIKAWQIIFTPGFRWDHQLNRR